jgi:hypothetical protein
MLRLHIASIGRENLNQINMTIEVSADDSLCTGQPALFRDRPYLLDIDWRPEYRYSMKGGPIRSIVGEIRAERAKANSYPS